MQDNENLGDIDSLEQAAVLLVAIQMPTICLTDTSLAVFSSFAHGFHAVTLELPAGFS